ncbi:glycosyl transferase family 1 [Methylobacterium sp. Leaf399]|uniref:glycosyltransferase n=1 Tax=unclassified Methylobacterium TaxID=2615210 RepID=UPI0006F4C055|nr:MULTISPECIES: glycosyltransferase [unclassified Methylobacterium]KQP54973.1 glycosyl transferase family 1 [Methylobacterium sp. Leaf108]KQT09131.1 glycosyl transferase family 1 [Methylobacterium sp. Leaf399]KQT78945.1 glycosyl transferase family 1 [Methylobacterium sp. Leaf466]
MTSASDRRRIYVDQTHLRGHVTGIERVAMELVSSQTLAPHEVREIRSSGLASLVAWQQVGLPALGLADRSALFVFPGFPPGPLSVLLGERCITYVYDTFLITRPQELNWKSRVYMAPSFRFAARFGQRFLVISRTTGAALRAFCRDDALVALLRPPVRDVFGLADMSGPAVHRPGDPLRLLAVGTIEPRKDYPAAIAIVAALNAAGMPAELHVVGRTGWGQHAFLADPPPFLTLHGYLDDAGLKALAGRCHLLISTSRAEGLGLPLLELQHGGMPVVAPEGEVFAEVLGSSGLFIAPDDPGKAAATLIEAVRTGRLGELAARARPNVARWNALAGADAERFRAFLVRGVEAYADDPEAVVGP